MYVSSFMTSHFDQKYKNVLRKSHYFFCKGGCREEPSGAFDKGEVGPRGEQEGGQGEARQARDLHLLQPWRAGMEDQGADILTVF